MRPQPGSFLWLLRHDLRLGWRGFTEIFGRAGAWTVALAIVAGAAVLHAIAWPISRWASPYLHDEGAASAIFVVVVTCSFTWMLAQSLFGSARTLYNRGDLDLLLGSPLPRSRVLAAKAAAIGAGSFSSLALLILPLANAGALSGSPKWLTLYPALVGLAMIAASMGLAISMALFFALGPGRARLWTQMMGAVIAGAFVLGAQVTAVLPQATREGITSWIEGAAGHGVLWFVRLPLDAVRGDGMSAAALVIIGLVSFGIVAVVLGGEFAKASLAAAGAPLISEQRRRGSARLRFSGGLARNMRRKEWRLLVRDPGMFAQLALQVIYTLPVAVVLLRHEALPPLFALAPTIVVVSAQIAGSLAWITVSGEDAPELIATAPVRPTDVDRAKLDAVALPVLLVMALPVMLLATVSMEGALITALVASLAAVSTALLNFWHPMPGNRRGMLRRHSQSKLVGLVEHALALLWAVAVVMALLDPLLALIPAAVVAAILVGFRRAGARARSARTQASRGADLAPRPALADGVSP